MIYLFSENKIVINPYHKYFQAPKTSADFSTEVLIRRSPPASQGYKDSNLEMTESESVALPFGDSPLLCQQWVFYMKTFHSSSTFSIFFRFFAKSFYRSSKDLDCTVQICKFNGLFPHQLCLSTGGIRKFLF